MWITGTSLEEAQEQQWFWSQHELSVQATSESEVRSLFHFQHVANPGYPFKRVQY